MRSYLLFFVLFTTLLFPQERRGMGGRGGDPSRFPSNGKIFGRIVDSQTLHAMEFVTITVTLMRDTTVVKGTATDKDGSFSFNGLAVGAYRLKTSFIGYAISQKDSIFVRPRQTEVDLGMIPLYPEGVQTGTVIITGQKDPMSFSLDKMVINVDQNIAASGGTALELMENIPSVTVDIDGTVSLRGSSNLNFLINGKPTGLEGISSSDVLTSIPANAIESIELITNPSAKYDPEGTAGIINIVMKKKDDIGINSVLNASADVNDRYNGSINANLRSQYVNLSGGYSGRFEKSDSWYNSERINYLSTTRPYINQNSKTLNDQNNHHGSFSIDFFPDMTNVWGLNLRVRDMNMVSSGSLISDYLDTLQQFSYGTDRFSESHRHVSSYSGDISYSHKFAERGHQIDAELDVNYNNAFREEDINQKTMPANTNLLQDNVSDNTNRVYVFKVDYENEFDGSQKFEAGTRVSYKSQSSLASYLVYDGLLAKWVENTSSRSKFNYKEQLYSLYATYMHRWGDFGAQAGLRVEHATAEPLLLLTNVSYKNDYLSFFPSVYLGYNFDIVNELRFNYSRRVDRPNERQLLPYYDVSDSLSIQSGNPELKPQFIDSYELGYSTMIGKSSYSTNLFLKQTNRMISSVVIPLSNGATLSTFENIAEGKNYGVEFMTMQPLFPWFRFNGSVSWYRNTIQGSFGSTVIDVDNISWNTRGSLNISFLNYQLQVSGNYRAPSYSAGGWGGGGRGGHDHGGGGGWGGGSSAQTRSGEMYSMDMAVKGDFFERKLSLTLRIQDVLDSRKFNSETTSGTYYQKSYRKPQTQTVFLGLTYRFNYNERDEQMDEDDDMIFF